MISWTDPRLVVPSDTRRRARYRALQGWYRETVLGVPPGQDRAGRTVSTLLPLEEVERDPGLNFIDPAVLSYANERVPGVLNSGGTLEVDRLRRNMLSSMPLCFNLFGAIRSSPEAPAFLSEAFATDIARIDVIECEWAPNPDAHLRDRTAFDAYIAYRDSQDRKAFIGVETKYTEPFSRVPYASPVYSELTTKSGWFKPGAADRLVHPRTNQLWRMLLLAISLTRSSDFPHGRVVVVAPDDDEQGKRAVGLVRDELLDDRLPAVDFVPLEELISVAKRHVSMKLWANEFERRYLDMTPVIGTHS